MPGKKKKDLFDYFFSDEYYSKLKTCRYCLEKIEPFGPVGCPARSLVKEGPRSYALNCESTEKIKCRKRSPK